MSQEYMNKEEKKCFNECWDVYEAQLYREIKKTKTKLTDSFKEKFVDNQKSTFKAGFLAGLRFVFGKNE